VLTRRHNPSVFRFDRLSARSRQNCVRQFAERLTESGIYVRLPGTRHLPTAPASG
jgi:hypothetical protein